MEQYLCCCVCLCSLDRDNYTFTVVPVCTNLGCKVAQATKFCTVALIFMGCHCTTFTLLAPGILRWLQDFFLNLCTPTFMTVKYCVVDIYCHLVKTCCLYILGIYILVGYQSSLGLCHFFVVTHP